MISRATPSLRLSACCSCSRGRRSSRSPPDNRFYNYLNTPVQIVGFTFAANRVLAFGIACVVWRCPLAVPDAHAPGRGHAGAGGRSDRRAPRRRSTRTSMSALAFAAGGALVAVAGTLVSTFLTFNPAIGVEFTMKALVVVMMGGVGNMVGSLVAGILLGVAEVALLLSPRFRPHPGGCLLPVSCRSPRAAARPVRDPLMRVSLAIIALAAFGRCARGRALARVRLRPRLHDQSDVLPGADRGLGAVLRDDALRLARHCGILRPRRLYGRDADQGDADLRHVRRRARARHADGAAGRAGDAAHLGDVLRHLRLRPLGADARAAGMVGDQQDPHDGPLRVRAVQHDDDLRAPPGSRGAGVPGRLAAAAVAARGGASGDRRRRDHGAAGRHQCAGRESRRYSSFPRCS